eukprot:1980807-Heterocapsa_arctica.AAC.1
MFSKLADVYVWSSLCAGCAARNDLSLDINVDSGYPRLGLRGWDDSFAVHFSLGYNLSQCCIQMISITLALHSCGARVAGL